MTDVTMTRDGNEFLVRAHTSNVEEFVDDMFGLIISLGPRY
jgi:hypothetical protein